MEDEELIRHQMEETRESITEKLECLEHKVTDSVAAVSDTVAQVRETLHEGAEIVKDTVHDSVETVKDAFDVPEHFRTHPWLALGGAVACGYVLGAIVSKPAMPYQPVSAFPPALPPRQHNGKHKEHNGKHKEREQSTGLAEGVLNTIKPEIDMLKGLALGATFGLFREMLAREAPPQMGEQIRSIFDGVTRKLGGNPMPSSEFPERPAPAHAAGETRW